MDDPERRLSFLVHRVNALMSRAAKPMFSQYGLDPITSRILVLVLNREITIVGDVVELLSLPQSTVSHQIKRLEKAGLLKRVQDPADNRTFRVQLTTRGRRVAQACDRRSQRLNGLLMQSFSASAGNRLLRELDKLVVDLERLDPETLSED